jgi:hypothetical protein
MLKTLRKKRFITYKKTDTDLLSETRQTRKQHMVTPEKFEADGALKVTKATTNPNPAQL